jgi:hypothetical protein
MFRFGGLTMGKFGPAPLPEEDKRRHQFGVYFNDAELAVLLERAVPSGTEGKSDLGIRRYVGRYLRNAALGTLPNKKVPDLNRAAWRELSRAAANLNQIAHHLNSGGDANHAEIMAALAEFRRSLIGDTGADDEGEC